ncbi:hypothetical protein MML48_5g00005937 [Holotrichia oblita]|uniref:Uncharacterized protein n=1 Tax=Holotrichia oblita TaxID=644536 RepID=A0ACB9T641_HOLOL|nr:hypothetical protein MML48_5g00005937 [Holotrichia oblita]
MKKAFNSKKLSKPTKILRRVLSKTSNSGKINLKKVENTSALPPMGDNPEADGKRIVIEKQTYVKPTINVEAELLLLKEQINSLQNVVSSMQNETEKKEVAIANLAREKERLAGDLKKQQRTNTTLKQQLEDERQFYYKEKEMYCQEMNDCKKLKKTLKSGDQKSQLDYYKKEAMKLKESLTQTLEANYNLSVKFLRMKNTKYCIKNRLKKLERVHEAAVHDFQIHLDKLKSELTEIVERELQVPIPPSNKKYLQIVKQNGGLTHENLCLRLEIDRLTLEVERMKMLQVRNETNSKLKYINHKNKSEISDRKKSNHFDKDSIKEPHYNTPNTEEQLIRITNDDDASQKSKSLRKESEMSIRKIFENEIKCCLPGFTAVATSENGVGNGDGLTVDNKEENFDLIQLHENPSQSFTNDSEFTQCYNAVRTQSAPEIVQTSLFVNDT